MGIALQKMQEQKMKLMRRRVGVTVAFSVLSLCVMCGMVGMLLGYESNHPYPVAHRGSSGEYPENTAIAVKEALKVPRASVEFDVQITKDGVVIGMHDKTVDRTTNGKGKVNDLTWEYISTLDAGSWKGAQFSDVKVPKLSEILTLFAAESQDDAVLLLDTKEIGAGILPAIATLLQDVDEDVQDRILLGCWNKKCLEAANDAGLTHTKRIIITPFPTCSSKAAFASYSDNNVGFNVGLQFGFVGLCKGWTHKAQSAGFSVWAWTLDAPKHIAKVASWGVNGVVSNFPSLVNENGYSPLSAIAHHGHHGHHHGHHGHHHDHHGHHEKEDKKEDKKEHTCPHKEAQIAAETGMLARACLLLSSKGLAFPEFPSEGEIYLQTSPACAALADSSQACSVSSTDSHTLSSPECASLASALRAEYLQHHSDPKHPEHRPEHPEHGSEHRPVH